MSVSIYVYMNLHQQIEYVILLKTYLFIALMYIVIAKMIEYALHVMVYVLNRCMI